MFPPPQPWTAVRPVDLDTTYVAFTSRFALRSLVRVPAFFKHGLGIQRQVKAAPGVVGYSLGADLLKLHFYTLSVWEDAESLQAFARAFPHEGARAAFATAMRAPSVFVQWSVRGADLPVSWQDALARQRAQVTGPHREGERRRGSVRRRHSRGSRRATVSCHAGGGGNDALARCTSLRSAQ